MHRSKQGNKIYGMSIAIESSVSRNTITFLLTPIGQCPQAPQGFSAESFLVIVSSSLTVINSQRMVLVGSQLSQSSLYFGKAVKGLTDLHFFTLHLA